MGLNAGQMKWEIVIQTAPVVRTENYEEVLDWDNATSQTVWAQWMPAGTREVWQSQLRPESFVDGLFRIYDLSPRPTPYTTRILFDNRVFDIKPYVEIDQGEGLEIPVVARGE
jgi:head-tail adaptor